MKIKRTKKYLEAENKWLWYHHEYIEDRTKYMEVRQYNNRGTLIAMSSSYVPPKQHRPKHPDESTKNLRT